MSTRNYDTNETRNENSKKVEEHSCTDSGFLSGFVDSCEIESRELDADNKTEETSMEGISQRDDKGECTDSGIISSGYISQTESHNKAPMLIEASPYVPECLKGSIKRNPPHPAIDKYFEQDEDGYTKLHIAILHNIEPAINTLISLVPDSSYLNIRNFCGQTALHLAVLLEQNITVKRLIDAGADVNIRDNRCNTALHLACLNQNAQCVQIIISAVYPQKDRLLANLEQWNYEGETCFFIACKSRNFLIMEVLEKVGANVNAREGRSGYSPLHMAVEKIDKNVIEFLCEKCNALSIDTENYGGLTAFQLSLLMNQEKIANYLIKKGATPYYTPEDSDIDDDDDMSDFSGDELEQNQIISKIAEIAVN